MNLQFKPNRHPELDSGSVGLEEEFPFITADAESSSA